LKNKSGNRTGENKKKKDDSTIVLFNSYLFKLNFCKAPFEQDEQLYRRKREKQYGSSC
jgi:predicted transposase YdaD